MKHRGYVCSSEFTVNGMLWSYVCLETADAKVHVTRDRKGSGPHRVVE
jgi:hypothetical protein